MADQTAPRGKLQQPTPGRDPTPRGLLRNYISAATPQPRALVPTPRTASSTKSGGSFGEQSLATVAEEEEEEEPDEVQDISEEEEQEEAEELTVVSQSASQPLRGLVLSQGRKQPMLRQTLLSFHTLSGKPVEQPPEKRGPGRRKGEPARTSSSQAHDAGSDVLPANLIKHILSSHCKLRVAPSALSAIREGLAVFVHQVTQDLEAVARHDRRSTIEVEDVERLMEKQRQLGGSYAPSLRQLIHQHLPMEYVAQLLPVARAHNRLEPEPEPGEYASKRARL